MGIERVWFRPQKNLAEDLPLFLKTRSARAQQVG